MEVIQIRASLMNALQKVYVDPSVETKSHSAFFEPTFYGQIENWLFDHRFQTSLTQGLFWRGHSLVGRPVLVVPIFPKLKGENKTCFNKKGKFPQDKL